MFSALPGVTNIRSISEICVTSLNISWNAPNITCGDVFYSVSVSQDSNEGNATVDRFPFVTPLNSSNVSGLDNNLSDVTITVTAIDRVGKRNGSIFSQQLCKSEGKFV